MTQHGHASISIDDDVEVLNEQIRAITEMGKHDDVADDRVYDLSIRWGTAIAGRLRRLVHYSSLGLLDDIDEQRFQALCAELRGVSGLVDRFGLRQPDLSGV